MKFEEYLKIIANGLTRNTATDIVPYCAKNVTYISDGKIVAQGREAVRQFLQTRKAAFSRDAINNYGYLATVKETSVDGVKVRNRIVAVSQFDKYNCTGYMVIKTNIFGKIKKIDFRTDSDTIFKCDSEEKWCITKVPADAHDAIGYRAFALGIMDKHVVLSKHIQQYDEFQRMVQETYAYIMNYLVKDFNDGITNAAGYIYASAMIVAFNRKNNSKLSFCFSPADAVNGTVPRTPSNYQKWITAGYEMGKKLFLGFNEYAELRHPRGKVFDDQLMQSYMDMCLYGSIQANKDMDMNNPLCRVEYAN